MVKLPHQTENAISQTEALELVRKLITERTSVQASFFAASGLVISLKGFVDSVTEPTGIVVSTEHPVSRSKGAWVSVPIYNRTAACLYADKRNFPEQERDRFVKEFGDTLLLFAFTDCQERLALTFTL